MNKEIDWEERHFQICLALISRANLHSYHSSTVTTIEIVPKQVIKTATKMVEALQQHLKEQEPKTEK